MHFATILYSLLAAATASLAAPAAEAAPQAKPGPRQPVCVVPKLLFNSLPYKFELQVQNPKVPAVHNRIVQFIGRGTPGDYRAVLAPRGSSQSLSFTDRRLSFALGKHLVFTGYARPRNEWGVRQLSFVVGGTSEPLAFKGYYGCDARGKQQVELAQDLYPGWGISSLPCPSFPRLLSVLWLLIRAGWCGRLVRAAQQCR